MADDVDMNAARHPPDPGPINKQDNTNKNEEEDIDMKTSEEQSKDNKTTSTLNSYGKGSTSNTAGQTPTTTKMYDSQSASKEIKPIEPFTLG
jgi:hypothetical protein